MDKEPAYLGMDCVTPYRRSIIIRRCFWFVVQATLFRLSPRPCHLWRAGLLKIFGADIPELRKVVIFPSASIFMPWNLRLEPRSMVGPKVSLYNLALITLKRGANISQNSYICAGTHDITQWSMPLITRPISIGENTWIAANCFVGPGVSIGDLSVIGAGSVVLKDQPAQMICAGNPCKPIKERPLPH